MTMWVVAGGSDTGGSVTTGTLRRGGSPVGCDEATRTASASHAASAMAAAISTARLRLGTEQAPADGLRHGAVGVVALVAVDAAAVDAVVAEPPLLVGDGV